MSSSADVTSPSEKNIPVELEEVSGNLRCSSALSITWSQTISRRRRQRSIPELARLTAAVTEVDAEDQAPGLLHACALGEKRRGRRCFYLCLLDVHTVQRLSSLLRLKS